jgi:hypothetical protein
MVSVFIFKLLLYFGSKCYIYEKGGFPVCIIDCIFGL